MNVSRWAVIAVGVCTVLLAQISLHDNTIFRIILTIAGVGIASSSAEIAHKLSDKKGKK